MKAELAPNESSSHSDAQEVNQPIQLPTKLRANDACGLVGCDDSLKDDAFKNKSKTCMNRILSRFLIFLFVPLVHEVSKGCSGIFDI